MKKLILIFSLLLSSLASCKKYEEGPIISFRPAKSRIIGGWKVVSYTVNGIDSMQYIYNNHLDGRWSFNQVGSNGVLWIYSNFNYSYSGFWELDNHKKTIWLTLNWFKHSGNWYRTLDSLPNLKFQNKWDIIKLKNEDIKFQRQNNGDIYEIHFQPN